MCVPRWGTGKKRSGKWEDVDKVKFFFELFCVGLVLAAIVYAAVTGTGPENTGF